VEEVVVEVETVKYKEMEEMEVLVVVVLEN